MYLEGCIDASEQNQQDQGRNHDVLQVKTSRKFGHTLVVFLSFYLDIITEDTYGIM